ncbi:helix-turn-helix transcriptional regulator [Neobacillus mesonae]|uniref:helix-turn-helix transcriptional regulator n=1 Tax=Neobacillus mesonae TaxID=1193713 RepID=UPI00203ACE42|nr:helix-turn-helix transcriptional regulator [Neobacillus mesonae]MCM3570625.1 helix-turn-helix transcriptional regulator [Neobacillus mesonae]
MVRELRAPFRWSQVVLAKKIGVTRQTIGLIEKGDYVPSVILSFKIAKAVGVQVEEIFLKKKGWM